MERKLICILVANLFAASAPAWAQQSDMRVTGRVGAGGIYVDDDDARDASKLNEYQDFSSGALLEFDVRGRGSRYWFDLFGENLGRDDQYATARGGAYDVFKYRVWTDALKHNFLFNGISPHNGAGSPTQTATFPRLDTSTWNEIDIGYKRRDDGGFFEFQAATPWYFRVDANQVTWKGSKNGASSNGTSPGNGFMELSYPVDYKTRNVVAEAGYNSVALRADISYMVSQFENSEESLTWTNGYFSNGTDRTYLPPDNRYNRLAGNVTWRGLPLSTTLGARFTTDELKSSVELGTSVLGSGGVQTPTLPNTGTFHGKVTNDTFSITANSTPARGWDTRVYYNYRERENESTHVSFSTGEANELYAYEKSNLGFDVYFRINRGNRIGGGYDYLDTDRQGRHDFGSTEDKRIWLEYKNTVLDNVAGRLKFQRLERDSDFLLANSGSTPNDSAYWDRYVTAFDLSGVKQDSWKLSLDWSPAPNLDVGFEGIIKNNDFDQNTLGRLKDDRREIYVNASYGMPGAIRFSAFVDHEEVKYDSRHRVVGDGALSGAYEPSTPPTGSNYNWTGNIKDRNWAAGFAIDWPVSDRLLVKASAIYYKADGYVDLALQDGVPSSVTRPVPVSTWDDSRRTSFTIRADYALSKSLSLKAGYAYEKYEYADSQYDGYRNVVTSSTAGQESYLTGVGAFQQYKAHIIFGVLSWRF